MSFWFNFVLYEAVWFAAVIGAGHDLAWPAWLGTLLFAAWRLAVSQERKLELRLASVALLLGFVFDSAMVRSGLLRYAAPWPSGMAPAWILALWLAFAFTIVPLFGYLHARPWLAAAFGAIGGPLAYLAAARGWHAVDFTPPAWRALLALACGWGMALPVLTSLARRWSQAPATAVRGMP